jgi:transcriptional regulator with XRE-family HTH domain
LAHQANVSAAWLAERERGRRDVSVAVLDRLAKVLGVEAWEFLQPQGGPETKKAP